MSENTATTFVKRDSWPAGPWDGEVDRYEWRDERTGLPCLIVRNSLGALCGYAGVVPGHPWHGRDYDDVPADAHGGLTYAARCSDGNICHVAQPGEPEDVWWLGFDTAHSGDLVPGMRWYTAQPYHEHDEYRDVAYVRAQVADLARQIAEAA